MIDDWHDLLISYSYSQTYVLPCCSDGIDLDYDYGYGYGYGE